MSDKVITELEKWLEYQIEHGHAPDGHPVATSPLYEMGRAAAFRATLAKLLAGKLTRSHRIASQVIDALIPITAVIVYSYRGIWWGIAAGLLSILLLRGAEGFIWGSRNR